MVSAKRRIVIISAIVLAVLLIAACFSVSYAKWSAGSANDLEVDGTIGQFYIDVPVQDALPDLDKDTYYLKVESRNGEPRFYPFTAPANDECSLILELTAGDEVTAYKGKTVVSDLTKDWATGGSISEIVDGTFTIKQSTIHRFYYKIGFNAGKDALYVGCDLHLSFTFKDGTVDAIISYGDGLVGTPYLWLWTSAKNYTGGTWPGYTLADISSGAKSVDVSGLTYATNGLTFIISFRQDDAEQSRVSDTAFNTPFKLGKNYLTLNKTTLTTGSAPTPPTPISASTDGSDDVIVRKVSASANSENSFTYKNYVCVKRDYIDEKTVAYVNFSVRQTGSVNPANVTVTDFTVKRSVADASGNLIGSSSPEFVYNSPVGSSLASMSGTVKTKNGRTYIEGGAYLMLFFGDSGDQYYALNVTVTTDAAVDFELTARVSDADRRNAYAPGYGEAFGYYLGGEFNGIDMWDPRAAAKFTATEVLGSQNIEKTYYDNGEYVTYDKLPTKIDVTLDIELTAAGDTLKLYRLDGTGTRQGGDPTLWFIPKNIHKNYTGGLGEDATAALFNKSMNIIVSQPGTYTIHYVGDVTYMSPDGYYAYDRKDNEFLSEAVYNTKTKTEIFDGGKRYVELGNWNGVVDDLFITRRESDATSEVTVTFDAKGGTLASNATATVAWGEKLPEPPDPTNGDKTFVGWFTDSACTKAFDFDTPVTALDDFTLYAKWLDAEIVKHTVTFHYNYTGAPNSGVFKTIANVENGSTITKPSPDPTRTGHKFDGWYLEESCTNAWEFSTQAVTATTKDLYAKWTPNEYAVKFNLNGLPNTAAPEDKKVTYNTTVPAPTVEAPEHYTIEGWYTTAACTTAFDFSTKITAERTLYAKWYADDGVYYDKAYVQGLVKNTGNTDGTEYMALGVPQSNAKGAVVTFWYDRIERSSEIKPDCSFQPPPESGIELAKGVYNFYYKFNSSDNGLWIALSNHIIDFNANGGTLSSGQTYVYTENLKTNGEGTLSTLVVDPTRPGYRFDGWYTAAIDGEKVTSTNNNTFSSSATLYAHWVQRFTITFIATADSSWSDGTIKQEQKVDINSIPEALAAPQNAPDGQMFDCWSTSNTTSGGAAFDFTLPITGDVTLYVQWKDKPNETVRVTFDANNGSCDTEYVDISLGGTLSEIPTATRTNYDFDGWHTAASGGTPITATTTFNSSQTIYAHWVRTYTVTFNVNGGSGSVAAQTVRTGVKATTPDTAPIRSGYTFAGWYKDSNGSQKYDFETAVTGNITLYAKWYYSTLRADTYYVVGGMNGWGATVGYNLIENTGKASNLKSEYVIYGIELLQDVEFRVGQRSSGGGFDWCWLANESSTYISGSTSMSDNNFRVIASGTYNIYIHNYNDNNDWWGIKLEKVS